MLPPLAIAVLLLATQAAPPLVRRQAQLMGTVVELQLVTADATAADRASRAAFAEIARLEALMTDWRDDSTIGRLNAHAGDGQWIPLDADTAAVLARSLEVARQTRGAFDVTVGVFHGLWKLDEDVDGSVPSPAEIRKRLALVGWRDLELDPERPAARLKRAGQRVTLGGIAKGYAVDRAAAEVRKAGIQDFILQAGGDFYAAGKKGDRPWRIGIRDPRGKRDQYFAFAEVSDRSFSTSGDYERYLIRGGRRYHHILDPKTGWPSAGVRAVTVLAPDAFVADAVDTALLLLGPKAALALLAKHYPGVEAILVDARNQVHMTPGMRSRVTILRPPTDGL